MEKALFYAQARSDLPGPLAGVRVVEVTTTWAGPMCGSVLADLGAEVIKIELPGGEVIRKVPPFLPDTDPPLSLLHATVNRNKKSLCLDLRGDEGRNLFLALCQRCDVVVENFRPGTMDRWGVGYQAVSAVRSDVVYASISGFGQFGPDHDQVGYDPLAQAASGFLSLNGDPDGPPVKAATFLSDDLAGLHGAIAVLAALCHRRATGEGQRIDVSLLDSILFQSNGLLTQGAVGGETLRWGNEFLFIVPANVYACTDGYVYLGALLDPQWARLARGMDRPDLAEDPEFAVMSNRIRQRDEVNELVSAWVKGRSVGEVCRTLKELDVPVAPVRSYAEAAGDPHVAARDMLQHVEQADGTTQPITGPAAKFSRTPTRVRRGAPALGADTQEILSELGLDAEAIAGLRQRQVI